MHALSGLCLVALIFFSLHYWLVRMLPVEPPRSVPVWRARPVSEVPADRRADRQASAERGSFERAA